MERDKNLRKLQLEEKKILDLFVSICGKNNLRYYMLGGTLLGAIRHEGFIPWDDDIDVCMPREDYELFLKIAKHELKEPYYLSCLEYDENYRYCFSRISNREIKIKNYSANIPRVEDAWIDIIPLDGMPENKFILFIHKFRLKFLRVINQIAQYDELVDQVRERKALEKVFVKIAGWHCWRKIFDYRKTTRKIQCELKKYKFDDCDNVINYMAAYGFDEIFLCKDFGNGKIYNFEDSEYIGPQNADSILKTIYGNYRILPPENQRNKHNAEIIRI